MKRLLTLLIASLALFAVPAATADGPDPAVTVDQTGETYVYDFAALAYRLVPDFATGVSLNLNWGGNGWTWVGSAPTVDQLGYDVGVPWPSAWVAPSFAELPEGSLYSLGQDGSYHYVPGPDQAFALGATWDGTDWSSATHYDSIGDLPAPVGDPYTT